MPWKRQLLLCSHAGIAEPWKNIATSKICVTVFKMLAWAKRHYQSLCRGIKPTSQITLFIISLGLFPSNLENVWLFLYLKGVCPVLKQEYKICTKKGYVSWQAVFRFLGCSTSFTEDSPAIFWITHSFFFPSYFSPSLFLQHSSEPHDQARLCSMLLLPKLLTQQIWKYRFRESWMGKFAQCLVLQMSLCWTFILLWLEGTSPTQLVLC